MKPLQLRSRQWIVDNKGNIIIGEGRGQILENIDKTGSINQTAKIMKMSYKGVWSRIKVTEAYLKTKLVDTSREKGSLLTKEGKDLLQKYRALKERCEKADDQIFADIFEK